VESADQRSRDSAPSERFEALKLLYEENAKVAAVFWEWRHKVMTFFFTVIAALIALAGWGYRHDLGRFDALPLFVAGLLAFVGAGLNVRTGRIVAATYLSGARVESELAGVAGAPGLGDYTIYGSLLRSRVNRAVFLAAAAVIPIMALAQAVQRTITLRPPSEEAAAHLRRAVKSARIVNALWTIGEAALFIWAEFICLRRLEIGSVPFGGTSIVWTALLYGALYVTFLRLGALVDEGDAHGVVAWADRNGAFGRARSSGRPSAPESQTGEPPERPGR